MDDNVSTIDSFLPASSHEDIAAYFDTASFRFVQSGEWNRVFRLTDGSPLAGTEAFRPDAPDGYNRVPTESAIDTFVDALSASLSLIQNFLVRPDWNTFSVRPYIYPPGSGLGWHTDGDYAGAFIYYAHKEWHPDWGGELQIENEEGDSGKYVFPKPNRLVLLRGGVRHCIKKVDVSAGSVCRHTLAGFFYDKARLFAP